MCIRDRYNNGKGFTTRDDYAYQHPAMFPEALARDHIKSWSNEGDIVIDPFTGAGTTPAIAREEDRKFIGYEIDKKYYEIAQRRIEDRAARLVFEE